MINDPIADLLTRVRNGYLARLPNVSIPYSSLKEKIVLILKKNGYIVSFTVSADKREIIANLNDVRKTKYIPSFRRVSRPSQRIYIKATDIRKSRNGLGIYILSTPQGIITGYEARSLNVGGEILCEVF